MDTQEDLSSLPVERDDGTPAVEIQSLFRDLLVGTRHLVAAPGARRAPAPPLAFRIGWAAGVDAPAAIDAVPAPAHALVEHAPDGFVLNVTPAMTGEVGDARGSMPLGEAVRLRGPRLPVGPGTAARIVCGNMTFLVRAGARPIALARPGWVGRWQEQKYTLGAAAGLGLFLLMIMAVPADARALSLDIMARDPHLLRTILVPPEEKQPDVPAALGANQPSSPSGKRAGGTEGKAGKKNEPARDKRMAVKKLDDRPPELARVEAIEVIKNKGILGLMRAEEGSLLASVFGDRQSIGVDLEETLGNLRGIEIGMAGGQGGIGVVGTGNGGGGPPGSTIGTGVIDTRGRFGGDGGYGNNPGGLARYHTKGVPQVIPSDAKVRGALDKEIIRRIIRRHINEVKFCYEEELTKRPGIGGRVAVNFTIGGQGNVLASVLQETTLGAPKVEKCVVEAVKRWEFPRPEGGGLVIVSYPFNLTPAGGGGSS